MKPGKSMQELSESNELKTFLDRRLIKALGHPVREHILAVLNERVASAREIGEELGVDVSSFYHHVEELERLECIERVGSRARRGATEHFFRATETLFFDDKAWKELPVSVKSDLTNGTIQLLFDDVVRALDAGTFDARDDRLATWSPGTLDAQGWDEVTALMREALERLGTIKDRAVRRLTDEDAEGVQATIGLLVFETAGDGGEKQSAAEFPRP